MKIIRMSTLLCWLLGAPGGLVRAQTPKLEVAWPTPNTAFFDGKSIEAFIQPTASGVLMSGLFGGVRNGGQRFHEGLDLKPLARDSRSEPTDAILAAMSGVVRYISTIPGNSDYGRYIVIEHPVATPAVYTLYAHLSSIQLGLKTGDPVAPGQRIATMGRSSSNLAIAKAQAHLHFEIGVMMSSDFQAWYNVQKFGSKNSHGLWNGINLMGFDPLDFFTKTRAGSVVDLQAYFAQMNPAVRLRIATRVVPDFVRRYPSLLTKPLSADEAIGGWEIAFNETGIPFSWTPLTPVEMLGSLSTKVSILATDAALLKQWKCRSLIITRSGVATPGRDLNTVLQLLFGVR